MAPFRTTQTNATLDANYLAYKEVVFNREALSTTTVLLFFVHCPAHSI